MENKKHIVVIEDEQHLAIGIKYNLEAEGYKVTTIGDGLAGVRYCETNETAIDLIVLDLMLPGMSGYGVCEALRDAGFDMPILILSARNMSEDRTHGFNVGVSVTPVVAVQRFGVAVEALVEKTLAG